MSDWLKREVVGLGVALASLLVLVSLLSHSPLDPSPLHASTLRDRPVNLAGPLGATISDLAFQLLGLAAFLVPLVALVFGLRLLSGRQSRHPPGALGAGWALLALAVPAALAMAGDALPWRGGTIPVGGFLGRGLGALLEAVAGPVGRLVVVLFLLVVGLVLVSGLSLGAGLERLAGRLRAWWGRRRSGREARRLEERRRREREKVLRRQAEMLDREALPRRLTVKEIKGKGSFRIVRRKVEEPPEAPPKEPAPAATARRKARKRPAADARPAELLEQETFEFVEELDEYVPPPITFLEPPEEAAPKDTQALLEIGETITSKCREFRVEGEVVEIRTGPVITTYEFRLSSGVKISAVQNLAEDLALAIKTEAVRIERIPGRATVGIEVPNPQRQVIRLRQLLETRQFQTSRSILTLALGVDIHGKPVLDDLQRMPHLLIGGFTGSGKSVGINAMIMSILFKARPDQVKMILVDPKVVELGVYADTPHLLTPIISDPKKAANALGWAVSEMERRYRLLASAGVRNLEQFNVAVVDRARREALREVLAVDSDGPEPPEPEPLPYIVVVIDELADLMLTSSRAVEESITRLAQKARAVGIHLICATQRPSVDVLTGTIKANFPCRIAYKVRTRADSRTIIDSMGAERLLGKGDMLYLAPGTSTLQRVHGPLVTEVEIARVVRHAKRFGKPEYRRDVLTHKPLGENGNGRGGGDGDGDRRDDPAYEEAARLVVKTRKASASFIQRRLHLGYTRAARLIDMMEEEGLVGPLNGSKGREVLVPPDYFDEVDATRDPEDRPDDGREA